MSRADGACKILQAGSQDGHKRPWESFLSLDGKTATQNSTPAPETIPGPFPGRWFLREVATELRHGGNCPKPRAEFRTRPCKPATMHRATHAIMQARMSPCNHSAMQARKISCMHVIAYRRWHSRNGMCKQSIIHPCMHSAIWAGRRGAGSQAVQGPGGPLDDHGHEPKVKPQGYSRPWFTNHSGAGQAHESRFLRPSRAGRAGLFGNHDCQFAEKFAGHTGQTL